MAKPHYIRGWNWILQPGDEWTIAGLLAALLICFTVQWLAVTLLSRRQGRWPSLRIAFGLSLYAVLFGVALPYFLQGPVGIFVCWLVQLGVLVWRSRKLSYPAWQAWLIGLSLFALNWLLLGIQLEFLYR